MQDVLHLLIHTVTDSLKMLPFLFVAYVLMEYMEHQSAGKMQRILKSGKFGVVGGAVMGCLPQCGFSVIAANLYAGRLISIGTLLAVFIATSDEAVAVFLANPQHAGTIVQLLAVKLIIAVPTGLIADALARRFFVTASEEGEENIHHLCEHCGCEHGILKPAIKHTASTFLFILLVNFILHFLIEHIGEQTLGTVLMSGSFLQPLIAGLVGFLPSCASSVVLTELYIAGGISFGSAVAGLCTGAGVGLAVLLRANRNWKDNIRIVGILYFVGALSGILLQSLGVG